MIGSCRELLVCLFHLYRPSWPELCIPLLLWLTVGAFVKYQCRQACYTARHWGHQCASRAGKVSWSLTLNAWIWDDLLWKVYDESSVFSKAEEKVKLIHLEPELISFKSWKCGSGCPVPWGSECQTLKCLCPRDLLALADVTCSFHHVDYYKGHIFRKQIWKHKCWTKMWSVFLTLSSAIEMMVFRCL